MDPITWNESFSVGVGDLDHQHKRLIRLVNRLIERQVEDVRSETVSDALSRMTEYATEHFEREERYMVQYGYPELAEHREQHRHFRKKTVQLCMDAVAWKTTVPTEILKFLREWWVGHILVEDMRYKDFFREKGLT